MASNIIELVGHELSPNVLGRLATAIGESPASVARAATVAAPVVVAGIAQRAGTEAGATQLLGTIRADGYDAESARSTVEVLDDPAARQHAAEKGRSLVSSIFGNRYDGILETLSDHTAMKKGSLGILMSLLAPIVMRAIGKEVRDRHLDAKGLETYMGGQRAAIASVLPSGLAKMLQQEHAPQVSLRPQTREIGGALREGERKPRPLWPFLAALLVALALFTMARSSRRAVAPTPQVPEPAARAPETPPAPEIPPAPAVPQEPAPPPATPPSEPAIGGGPRDTVATPSMGGVQAIAIYIASGGHSGQKNDFVLEGVTFAPASSSLTKDGIEKLGELSAVLKAHPSAKIKLVGHTDSAGDPEANRMLSEDRANAARDELVRSGVAQDRIGTAGAGSDEPVAKNDNPADMAKNRRIDVIVLSP